MPGQPLHHMHDAEALLVRRQAVEGDAQRECADDRQQQVQRRRQFLEAVRAVAVQKLRGERQRGAEQHDHDADHEAGRRRQQRQPRQRVEAAEPAMHGRPEGAPGFKACRQLAVPLSATRAWGGKADPSRAVAMPLGRDARAPLLKLGSVRGRGLL